MSNEDENKKISFKDCIRNVDIKSFIKNIYILNSSINMDLALLTESMYDLNDMIGMKKFKQMVMDQILYLLVFNRNNNKHPMMHTLITGGPGRGKTTVAKILARIWSSMGIIGARKKDHAKVKSSIELPNLLRNNDTNNTHSNINNDVEIDSTKMFNIILTAGTIENHWENIAKIDKDIKLQLKRLKSVIHKNCDNKVANASKKSINKINDDINELSIRIRHISDMAMKNIIISNNKKVEEEKNDEPYVLAARGDFIGQWVGSTPHKTKNFLEKNRGKVIIIDEAYSLFPKDGDSFSMEALTIINTYASEYPEDYIFVFAGYEDLIQDGILKVQPGLKRRIKWHFSIEDYNNKDLANIFLMQCKKEEIKIDISFDKLADIFSENLDKFPNFGGSTDSLIHYCCLSFCRIHSDQLFETNEKIECVINADILERGLDQLKDHNNKNNCIDHINMYA